MYFTGIELKNFRNYKDEKIEFHPKFNIIKGNNAQGKTNLLESLYIMSLGKSFRTNKDTEMIGFSEGFCHAKSEFVKEGTERNIEIILSKEGKSIVIDGYKAKKTSELLEIAYVVAFTPEDMKIVKDEPERRRRFIDRELCMLKPVYYSNLARYKKILFQRNALLKKGTCSDDLMEVWEKSLAEYGSRIIVERMNFVEQIKIISSTLHNQITEGKEKLELSYEPSVLCKGSRSEIQHSFAERLKKERKQDLKRGSTGAGPHRDDIKINIDGVDVRNFGSQGQQRTVALSLKLAEINIIKEEKKEKPVLLLDDVLSELDEKRQEFLLRTLSDVQLFISTAETKESLFDNHIDKSVFDVKGGKVAAVHT